VAHIYWEHRELLDDPGLRRLLEGEGSPGTAGDCTPPMDVVETSSAVEVLMDLPGVPRSHLTVVFSQGTLVVAGRKVPASCAHREAAFHLAERGFGRFVRAVRLSGAFDAGRAEASLTGGELRIVLPRIQERRGRDIRIDVAGA
jgi:HSP20 family protein